MAQVFVAQVFVMQFSWLRLLLPLIWYAWRRVRGLLAPEHCWQMFKSLELHFPQRHFWPKKLNVHVAVMFGYIIVVSVLNWPLLLNLDSHVIGRSFEDVFEVLWQLSWMQSAIFENRTYPFYTSQIFYPHGWYTASAAQPSWYLLAMAPLTRSLGPVLTYNIVQLTTFVTAGFGVYLLVYTFTRQQLSSFLAGCIYIVAPVITIRQGGHLHTLLAMQGLPYIILFSFQALLGPKNFWVRNTVLAGLSLALTILASWYFVFIATLPTIGFLLSSYDTNRFKQRWFAFTIGVGLICTLLLTPFVYITWQARQAMFEEKAYFPLSEADVFSLSPDRLLRPNPLHSLWRHTVQTSPFRGEQDVVSIGYVTLLLAGLGLVKTKWRKTRPLLIMAVISLILALGTTLYWNGSRVQIGDVSPYAEQIFALVAPGLSLPEGHVAVPLPGLLFYRFIPFYDAIRVWTRFLIPFMLSMAVLAGLGTQYLLKREAPKSFVLLLLLLILFEGLITPYDAFTDVSVNARPSVNQWLAALPAETAIIEYPRPHVDKIAMYSHSLHNQPVVNGYMSQEPTHLRAVKSQLGVWPGLEAVPILREWDVAYVVISGTAGEQFLQDTLPAVKAIEGLCLEHAFEEGFMGFTRTYIFSVLTAGDAC